MIERGFCFTTDGCDFLVLGEAISYAGMQTVYLCQELTGAHRLMIFTKEEIRGEKTPALSVKAESEPPVKKEVEKPSYVRKEADPAVRLQNLLIEFLEADSSSKKLMILESMRGKAGSGMLKSMACSLDFEPDSDNADDIYYSLERHLKTRMRYEGKRR